MITERFEILEVIASTPAEALLRARDLTLHREVLLKRPGPALQAF